MKLTLTEVFACSLHVYVGFLWLHAHSGDLANLNNTLNKNEWMFVCLKCDTTSSRVSLPLTLQ